MKSKKNKLTNLLKTGILFFTISLLFWNCNDESINEFNENVAVAQVSNFQPIEIDEAKSFMNNLISKNKKQLPKGGFSVTIEEKSLNFKEVKKTDLTVPTFSASVKPNISSKVFMVKKQDSIYTCLYNYIPFENEDSSLDVLSGKIIISTIDGAFINGYKVVDGVFVSQYTQKTESGTASKTFRKDVEPDDDYIWDLGSLNEINITFKLSGSGGGGSSIFMYSNPVSSQGWMNLNLSGNTSSGGGGSSNGGNGGNSNSREMPLFPCDNPTPNGCEEEEDKIDDTNLKPCLKTILKDLKGLNKGVAEIIKKFAGNTPGFNWVVKDGNLTGGTGQTKVSYNRVNKTATSTFDSQAWQNASDMSWARTMLHESIHAYIVASFGVNYTQAQLTFADYFREYQNSRNPNLNDLQHAEIVRNYVNDIAVSLKNYGVVKGYNLSDQFYNDLSWGGLQSTNAFQSLPSSQQTRILNVSSVELTGKDTNNQTKTKKGTNAGC